MANYIDEISNSLRRWQKYCLGSNLYGSDPDPEVLDQLKRLGELVDHVRASRPDRFNIDVAAGGNPIEILRQALQPQFGPSDLVYPDDDVAILFSVLDRVAEELLAQQDDDSVSVDDEAEKLAPKDDPVSKPPEETVSPVDQWKIALFLRKIHCAKETAPAVLTDEFLLFGNYVYGAKRGPLQPVKWQFDTDTQKTFEGHGLLLAEETIPATTEFTVFDTTIFAFEDDGMSASQARLLAGILGNLATLGVNGLLTAAQASGVNVPPQAKAAYDNLALPGLIGVLAKLFGPEPFKPVKAFARTKWPPDSPADPPKWEAKIPETGGTIRSHIGEGNHDGNVTLYEATLDEITSPQGVTETLLVVLPDGGKYYIYIRYRVERA